MSLYARSHSHREVTHTHMRQRCCDCIHMLPSEVVCIIKWKFKPDLTQFHLQLVRCTGSNSEIWIQETPYIKCNSSTAMVMVENTVQPSPPLR